MVKKRKQANESDEQFKKRCAKDEPTATDEAVDNTEARVDNLEKGLGKVFTVLEALVAQSASKPEEESPKETAKVIDLPDATINIGEVSLRRDVALFLQERVKYVLASGQRPGWTAEKEIEMMVKKTMQSAKATTQAEESRQSTLSGEQRTN